MSLLVRAGGQVMVCAKATRQLTGCDKWHVMYNSCPIQLRDEHERGGGDFAVYLHRNIFAFSDLKSSRIRNIMGRVDRLCSSHKRWPRVGLCHYLLLCCDMISCSDVNSQVWTVHTNTWVKRWQLDPKFLPSEMWQHRYLDPLSVTDSVSLPHDQQQKTLAYYRPSCHITCSYMRHVKERCDLL